MLIPCPVLFQPFLSLSFPSCQMETVSSPLQQEDQASHVRLPVT